MIKILLDPGHGPGKKHNRGSFLGNEGDNNFKYCKILQKELQDYGFKVSLSRNQNEDPTLYQRGKRAKGYDLLISEHTNAFSNPKVKGVEVWESYQKPTNGLAKKICNAVSKAMNTKNRGVKFKTLRSEKDYFGVLRNNKARMGLIAEKGFHTNREDVTFYVNNMEKIAKAEAKAIADFFKYSKEKKKTFNLNYWVKRVKRGDFGNEPIRSKKLKQEGLTQPQINKIQNKINRDYKKSGKSKTFNKDYYATKVIRGDYGNEPIRSKKLKQEGLNDIQIDLIQKEVNRRYKQK